jgi:hypothetical protein
VIKEQPDDRVGVVAAERVEKVGDQSRLLATVGAGVGSTRLRCGVELIHADMVSQYVSYDK